MKIDWSKPVQTKEKKHPCRVLCTDAKFGGQDQRYMVVLEETPTGSELAHHFTASEDLYVNYFENVPDKHSAWVNIYRNPEVCVGDEMFFEGMFFSEENARMHTKVNEHYVATVKIEWEE